MSMKDPEARMRVLVADFEEAMASMGKKDYLHDCPKQVIGYIADALYPLILQAGIKSDT